MPVESSNWWRLALAAAIALWLVMAALLMIADVWDETNGMLAFSSASSTLARKVAFVLTSSLGFWRPLPTLVATVVLHFIRDFDVSWRVLRAINMVMLIAAVLLLARSAKSFLFPIAVLFSGSAIIAAGWYANIFDATALLMIAIGTFLLLQQRSLFAGVMFGIAFFCKETAALVFPFLLMLLAAGRITLRDAIRAAIPAAILGGGYFAIRATIVPFGSAGDVHGFAADQLLPTLTNLAESFWRQTLKAPGPGLLGFVWMIVSLTALRRPRLIAAALAFLAATAIIYWGMFSEYQSGVVIHHLNFVGRLYLIPVVLMLFILAIERRVAAMAILCIPIAFGAYTTWRDHVRFQRLYAQIYAAPKPLTVHYPSKPLNDTVRGIRIGDIPTADVTVDARNARLVFPTGRGEVRPGPGAGTGAGAERPSAAR